MNLILKVRETAESIIVEIGGTDYQFTRKDREKSINSEGHYLVYVDSKPTSGT